MKIDGVDTSKLPLHVLRSRLAVIPQVRRCHADIFTIHWRLGLTTLALAKETFRVYQKVPCPID